MGKPMCINIAKKHDDAVFCYDHHAENIAEVVSAGGIECKDEIEIAQKADIIITMVPKTEHSKAAYTKMIGELKEGKICIDMSTIDPAGSVEISKMVKATGAQFADAPVVKSKPAAIAGKLGIYVGCDEELFDKIKPILAYMGENIIRMGGNGKGLVMKICHNALVSQIQNGVNETSTLAAANGIDILTYAQAISYGGAGNWYLDSKKDVLAKEDFTTAFSIENEHKDIGICLKLADECGVYMPGEENAKRVYDDAIKAGYGKEDFSATVKVVKAQKK